MNILDHVKWLLLVFENLSGLKINYAKSEMYPLNVTSIESRSLATVLGCQLSTLPLTYLGFLLINKIEKKKI